MYVFFTLVYWRGGLGSTCTLDDSVGIVGVLDEPYSAKPPQRSSHTGPTGYIGSTKVFHMYELKHFGMVWQGRT
jgi:hypothetical protein